MDNLTNAPLSELHIDDLYKLLAGAWTPSLRLSGSDTCFITSAVEMGKREFDAIAYPLQDNLSRAHADDALACVASTIHRNASWMMPELLVTEIARRRGFVRTEFKEQAA